MNLQETRNHPGRGSLLPPQHLSWPCLPTVSVHSGGEVHSTPCGGAQFCSALGCLLSPGSSPSHTHTFIVCVADTWLNCPCGCASWPGQPARLPPSPEALPESSWSAESVLLTGLCSSGPCQAASGMLRKRLRSKPKVTGSGVWHLGGRCQRHLAHCLPPTLGSFTKLPLPLQGTLPLRVSKPSRALKSVPNTIWELSQLVPCKLPQTPPFTRNMLSPAH